MEGECPSEKNVYVCLSPNACSRSWELWCGLRLAAQRAVRCAGEQVICELCDFAACWT